MSLIQSAKLYGHDAYTYLKDVFTRLPTQQANENGSCGRIVCNRFSCARRGVRTLTAQYEIVPTRQAGSAIVQSVTAGWAAAAIYIRPTE